METVTVYVEQQPINVRSHLDEQQRRWYLIDPLLGRLRYTRSSAAAVDGVSPSNLKMRLELGNVLPDDETGPCSRFVTIDGFRELLHGIRSEDACRFYSKVFEKLRAAYHDTPRTTITTAASHFSTVATTTTSSLPATTTPFSTTTTPSFATTTTTLATALATATIPRRIDIVEPNDEVRAAVEDLLRAAAANGYSLSSMGMEWDEDAFRGTNESNGVAPSASEANGDTGSRIISETNSTSLLDSATTTTTTTMRSRNEANSATMRSNEANDATSGSIETNNAAAGSGVTETGATTPGATETGATATAATGGSATANRTPDAATQSSHEQQTIARLKNQMPCIAVFVVRPPSAKAYVRVVRGRLCHVRSIVSSIRSTRSATGRAQRRRGPTATWKMHATLVYCRAVRCSQYTWLHFCETHTELCDRFRFCCGHTEMHVNEDPELLLYGRPSFPTITDSNVARVVVRALDDCASDLSSRSYLLDDGNIVVNPYRLLGSASEVLYRDDWETNGDRRIVLTVPEDVLRAMLRRRRVAP